MKKRYIEFFCIPKNGKVREKVMLCRTAVTVMIIMICLAAMGITAYAYFSHSVISGSNRIQAANFDAQITVTDAADPHQSVSPSYTGGKKTVFTFANPGTYLVHLTKGSSTAQTGFCIVSVGEDTYHTQQIGMDITANHAQRTSVDFLLEVNTANTVVEIESHWGTSSHYNGFDSAEDRRYSIESTVPLRKIVIGSPAEDEQPSDHRQPSSDNVHIVAQGETLSEIAQTYHTTVARIVSYNNIPDPNLIRRGTTLILPPADWQPPADGNDASVPPSTAKTTLPASSSAPSETESVTPPTATVPTETSSPSPSEPGQTLPASSSAAEAG